MNNLEITNDTFQDLKSGAERNRTRRNRRLLNNHQKEVRNFTRTEASSYLDVNARALDKYCEKLNIDPRRHEDSQWSVDLNEIYKIRASLPEESRKSPVFKRSDKQKTQVLVIQNQKGGVGKTVTAATVASGLATEFHQEYRVGLIDMDGQATLSMYYATEAESEGCLSVGDLLMENYELEEGESIKEAISEAFLQTTIPNLRILPASQSDRAIEGWFHESVFNKEIESPYKLLNNLIEQVRDEFDIIIIDTPPSLNYATYNAYYAATSIIFPLSVTQNDIDATCSYFSYIPQVWALLKNADHKGYDFMKLLLTNHKEGSTTTELQNGLYESFSKYLYPTQFKNSEAIKKSSSLLSTVFDMSKSEYPNSKSSYQVAQSNAFEVTSQIQRDLLTIWLEQDMENKTNG